MSQAHSGIGQRQNTESALALCMATRQGFDNAMGLMLAQLAVTLALPTAAALVGLIWPHAKPTAALLGLLALVADVVFLDPSQKRVLKAAARLGEAFDVFVLQLPWNRFLVEDEPPPEDVRRLSRRFEARRGRAPVIDWYPAAAAEAPLHLGRILCQRANLNYNAQLRRAYTAIIQALAFLLVAVLLVAGVLRGSSLAELIIAVAPAVPVVNWGAREYYRQREAAETVERLVKLATGLWRDALAGACDADGCRLRCREFQDAIFAHRSRAPMLPPGLYGLKRLRLEDEMNAAATDLVAQWKALLQNACQSAEAR